MTRRTRRRGYTLTELVSVLPVWLALMTSGYLLVNGTEHLHARDGARRQEEARIRDIVRRVQDDAGEATAATIEVAQDGRRLSLRLPAANVIYTATAGRVTRSEEPAGGPAIRYTWPLDRTAMDYQLEAAGPASRIVWIRCTMDLPYDRGPDVARQLSVAALVGRGGVR